MSDLTHIMTDIPIHLRKRFNHRVVVEISYPGPISGKMAVSLVQSAFEPPAHVRLESVKLYSRVVAREKGSLFSFIRSFLP